MGTSEACMHLLSGQGIWNPSLKSNPCMGIVNFAPCSKWLKNSRVKRFHIGIGSYPRVKPCLPTGVDVTRKLDSLSCKCLRDDRNVGIASSGLDGPLHIKETEKSSPGSTNGTVSPSVDQVISGKSENVSRGKVDSIEDEAWELLRESIVNYCGNPVGTIAANEPNSSNLLNYDQVFIRDFIPSGIAFLLKEEYDIVRNFILHTLQIQVKYDS